MPCYELRTGKLLFGEVPKNYIDRTSFIKISDTIKKRKRLMRGKYIFIYYFYHSKTIRKSSRSLKRVQAYEQEFLKNQALSKQELQNEEH